ncbi:MAG TPA: hypothetical protein PKE25_12255 [Novosphingobium sp.]|nr:hypothetical protein [Novosphingobium sp.]
MSIHFSAAADSVSSRIARALIAHVPLRPANDNGPEPSNDLILRAALHHFAEHGLSGARIAAERVATAADREQALHWLAICRALDRRMGARLAGEMGLEA